MRYVDAHCHLDFPRFDGCLEQELAVAREAGVTGFVVPGVRARHWARVQALASGYKGVCYCLGIHPWYVGEHGDADLKELEEHLSGHPELCVGVGECGLDRIRGELEAQLPWFEAQIHLAARYGYPLVIHSVRAHDEVYAALRRGNWNGRALIHGFSGSYQQAEKLVGLGCFIGVGGVITHDRAHKTRDALSRLPAESLIVETDAPDMAPEGVARGCNAPVQLVRIVRELAGLRGTTEASLAPVLLANVQALYGRHFGEKG